MNVLTFAIAAATALSVADTLSAGDAELCSHGSGKVLSLTSWVAEFDPDSFGGDEVAVLTVVLRNETDRTIRMVDGYVAFRDALGGNFPPVPVPRDMVLAPGETVTDERLLLSVFHVRLARDVRPQDVHAATCVRSVLYEDGAVEEF